MLGLFFLCHNSERVAGTSEIALSRDNTGVSSAGVLERFLWVLVVSYLPLRTFNFSNVIPCLFLNFHIPFPLPLSAPT